MQLRRIFTYSSWPRLPVPITVQQGHSFTYTFYHSRVYTRIIRWPTDLRYVAARNALAEHSFLLLRAIINTNINAIFCSLPKQSKTQKWGHGRRIGKQQQIGTELMVGSPWFYDCSVICLLHSIVHHSLALYSWLHGCIDAGSTTSLHDSHPNRVQYHRAVPCRACVYSCCTLS